MLPMTAQHIEPRPGDWNASGSHGGVACSTPEAAQAGLDVLREGGSAADAFITAAFVQAVVWNGSTTVAGAFFLQHFAPESRAVEFVSGVYGPAADEDYEGYDGWSSGRFSGRGMPAPGFVAGAWRAHQEFGRLPWNRLLAPAQRYARDGFRLGVEWSASVRRSPDALRDPASHLVWIDGGAPRLTGSVIRQLALADTLDEIVAGPDAHYTGRFAAEYVSAARARGGRLRMSDLAEWQKRIRRYTAPLDTAFAGVQMASRDAECAAFVHCVVNRLDIRSRAQNSAEALDMSVRAWGRAFRLAKERPLDEMLDPSTIESEADTLFSRPRDPIDVRAAFGTNGVVAVDPQGNVASGVHTINCPTAFGVGTVVGGAYAGYVLNRRHAVEGKVTVEGVGASEMVVRNGQAVAAAASPGFSCMVAPWQFVTHMVEFGMDARAATLAPRFGLATPRTT